MGHNQRTYLDDPSWNPQLSREERMQRGPFQSFYGIQHPDAAPAAVSHARDEAEIASEVLAQVKEQAVYSLLAAGLSIRAIAGSTGIPKSEVGRISRRLGRDGALPGSRTMALSDPDRQASIRDRIRQAWCDH